ncbi:MAG: hypothetical protein ACE5NA_11750 [Nitrospiraceae bacterium]
MNFSKAGLIAVLCLCVAACSHWRDSYLEDSVDQATKQDVKEKLGPPNRQRSSLLEGTSVWMYRYSMTESELHPWNPSNMGRGVTGMANKAAEMIGKPADEQKREKLMCVSYELEFDKQEVLRNWKREPCSP